MTKSTQTTSTPQNRVSKSLIISLFVIWLMLNSTLAWQVWVLGLVLAVLGAIMLKDIAAAYAGTRINGRTIVYYFAYMGLFLKELVKSNLTVARLVLLPDPDIQPAIIQVKISLKSAVGRLALANSITLTPGTLVVEITDDSLFIHCINVDRDDPEKDLRTNVKKFEKYLKVVYG